MLLSYFKDCVCKMFTMLGITNYFHYLINFYRNTKLSIIEILIVTLHLFPFLILIMFLTSGNANLENAIQ